MAVFLSCVALFAVGSLLSLFTGRQAVWGGVRMLLIGSVAGAVTYVIGDFLGARIR
jgi:VIT1/CCC1 family predicted Fe2+/Mn2+ transporter